MRSSEEYKGAVCGNNEIQPEVLLEPPLQGNIKGVTMFYFCQKTIF